MKSFNLKLCILVFITTGCVSLPPQKPDNERSSIIAVSIKIEQPIPLFKSYPEAVCFIKLGEKHDILKPGRIIQSNYSNGDHIYLLNAEPGRYAAVAAFEKAPQQSGSKEKDENENSAYNSFYFSRDIIELSEIEVMPGEISFMGSFTLKKPFTLSFSDPDEAQLFYRSKLQPRLEKDGNNDTFVKIFSTLCGSTDYAVAISSKEIEKNLVSELDFLKESLENFNGTFSQRLFYKNRLEESKEWIDKIEKRMAKINNIKTLDETKDRWIIIPDYKTE